MLIVKFRGLIDKIIQVLSTIPLRQRGESHQERSV